jgi:hypothetical protein
MTRNSEVTVGPHRFVREAEDIFGFYFGANVTEKEMLALLEVLFEHTGNRRFFLMLDLSKVDSVPAPVRRAIGEAAKRLKWRAVAMYGASVQLRLLSTLINNALAILSKAPFPQKFFESREAALAWCEELRARQDAEGA